MPNESEVTIIVFDFEGKTNAKRLPGTQHQLDVRKAEEETVEHLNPKADELATELQKEVDRVFQPLVSGPVISEVEVEFRYESDSSISAAGIITVLGALGPFAADVGAGALAPLLAKLLESGLRRVSRWWLQQTAQEALTTHEATLEPITMNVSTRQVLGPTAHPPFPVPDTQTRLQEETRASLSGQSSTPWLQVQQQTNPQPPVREPSGAIETSGTHWLFPAIAIGTAVVIVLLAVILTIVIMQAP